MAFEDIMDRVSDLAQAGAAKAREIAEIMKLKVNNAAEEDTIRKAYIDLGKLYYAERGMAPEGAYAALCEKITASKQKIEENTAKIAEMRAAGNIYADVYTASGSGAEQEPEAPTPEQSAPEQPPVVVEPLADEKIKE